MVTRMGKHVTETKADRAETAASKWWARAKRASNDSKVRPACVAMVP